jgi:UDP-N-acetylmuramoyl-L-alanyl-D-glutamate--2,6-diaminopimelate ligase
MMLLSTLLDGSGVRSLAAIGADPDIAGVTLDSRRVEPGGLFLAIRGLRADGEGFVDEAIQRGARAILAASPRPAGLAAHIGWVQVSDPRLAAAPLAREWYGRPDESLELVGVTGTNGKTTVTYLVESVARAAGKRCGRIGTLGYSIDGRGQSLDRTTPEAPDVFRLLSRMREQAVDVVAMEVSSHALALGRVAGARFAVGAFLNLGRDHLDFHRDDAAYFAAKAALIAGLGANATAVLPADTEHGRELSRRTRARVVTFGRLPESSVRLSEEHSGLDGASAVLETPLGRLPVRTFLLGDYNLDNVAAAAACAVALGLPGEAITAGVLALEGVPGRMERVRAGQPFTVVVDYAHTAAALERALSWARGIRSGRVLVVFGCGGARDREKRPEMGRVAATLADLVYLTSDNPRDEDPEQILGEIAAGVAQVSGAAERCVRLEDRESAIRTAIGQARAGDVIVIAGKGHETVQVLADRTRPLDDRAIAQSALENAGFRGHGVASGRR